MLNHAESSIIQKNLHRQDVESLSRFVISTESIWAVPTERKEGKDDRNDMHGGRTSSPTF